MVIMEEGTGSPPYAVPHMGIGAAGDVVISICFIPTLLMRRRRVLPSVAAAQLFKLCRSSSRKCRPNVPFVIAVGLANYELDVSNWILESNDD